MDKSKASATHSSQHHEGQKHATPPATHPGQHHEDQKHAAHPAKTSAPPPHKSAEPHRQPPKLVYRGDKRPPSEIFAKGFTASGGPSGDDDLLAHVIGGIKNLEKTAFISTSQSRRVPAAFIKPELKPDGSEDSIVDEHNVEIKYIRRVGYIYSINTTGLDMVYVPDFLEGKERELKKFGYQQEWAVKGSIPGKNVKDAQHVDGYIWRYSDLNNMPQGVDALFPPHKSPFKETVANPHYAFK